VNAPAQFGPNFALMTLSDRISIGDNPNSAGGRRHFDNEACKFAPSETA
jgi:hypothetical protein